MQILENTQATCDAIICDANPSVGVVIGTFAAVPYVHLQLESWRRHYPEIPLLVNDDGSPYTGELRELCGRYGAEFIANTRRMRRTVGDMSAYVQGFDWAESLGLELLVKLSRRFIPLHDWLPEFQRLAYRTQYATYSQCCDHFNFGFRTECIGFHVPTWLASDSLLHLRQAVHDNTPCFVEGRIHELAREVHCELLQRCRLAREYQQAHPRPADRNAYGVWTIMTERRVDRQPGLLWHDCESPFDYCRVARTYGLNYRVEDFIDPNQGCGLGQE